MTETELPKPDDRHFERFSEDDRVTVSYFSTRSSANRTEATGRVLSVTPDRLYVTTDDDRVLRIDDGAFVHTISPKKPDKFGRRTGNQTLGMFISVEHTGAGADA